MRHMMIAIGMAVFAAPLAAAPALDVPSGRYASDPTHTSVTWRIKHLGLSNYTARFAKIEASVDLDAAAPANSKLSVTIDANSVRTDFPFPDKTDFDKEVGGDARFLNGEKFPQIKFVSTKIVATGAKTAKITGDLTLRGVTKPVTLDAVLNGTMPNNPMMKVPVFGISATGVVHRADFGMTFGAAFLGADVELLIEAEFRQAK